MYTIIYLVNGERYRDASGSKFELVTRLHEIQAAGFQAWIEPNIGTWPRM